MKYQTVLFDMDGTLLDTLMDMEAAVNHILTQYGYPARTLEEVRRFVGNGAGLLIHRALPQGVDPAREAEVLAAYRAYYQAHNCIRTRPYEGIPEALAALRERYPLAIVSNKPDAAVKTLCADIFPGIYARGESPDCPRKPAADMVYKAMASIGADTCIYVGDSDVDVLTANNAGVPCLSVLWGFRDRACMEAVGAKHFCESPAQLVADIEEIIHGK